MGRSLWLYVEAVGAAERRSPEGRYASRVTVVGRFYADDGHGGFELLGDKKLGTKEVASWRSGDPLGFGLQVTLGEVPPGRYAVEVLLDDGAVTTPVTSERQIFHLGS